MQPFIKQFFFEFITNATLGRRADGVAGSLEEEAKVVGVATGKVEIRTDVVTVEAGVVTVKADVVVEASIARIGAGIVGVKMGVIKIGMEGAGVGGASVRKVSVGKVGIGGAGMRGAGVVLEQTGVVGLETGSRNRPAQISLTKLRWTLVSWSFSSRRSQLGIRFYLHICQSCDIKNN